MSLCRHGNYQGECRECIEPAALSLAPQPDAQGELERLIAVAYPTDKPFEAECRVEPFPTGSLVRYDQAAALIAAQARELAEARAERDSWAAIGKAATKSLTAAQARLAAYDELIYAVGKKYPGETRHQTALRYIQQAEGQPSDAALASSRQGGVE